MSRARRFPADRPSKPTYQSWCSGATKNAYGDRQTAKRAARDFHPGEHLSAYRCPHDRNHWHIGHMRPDVADGTVTRDDAYGGAQ